MYKVPRSCQAQSQPWEGSAALSIRRAHGSEVPEPQNSETGAQGSQRSCHEHVFSAASPQSPAGGPPSACILPVQLITAPTFSEKRLTREGQPHP